MIFCQRRALRLRQFVQSNYTDVSTLATMATMATAEPAVTRWLLVILAAATQAVPMPYPLPASIRFGTCGDLPPGVSIPGCTTSVALAPKVSVRCSTEQGCSAGCAQSKLAQGVFARYEARLGAQGEGNTYAMGTTPSDVQAPSQPAAGATSDVYWWALNNTNCNLHDMPNTSCSAAGGVAGCKATCARLPACGGFLHYPNGHMALKNATCWDDVGPLPASDAGDMLYVMRDVPMPQPLPPHGGVLTVVEVCIASPSEALSSSTNESYTLTVPASASNGVAMVQSESVFGAMHGLETLTQLVDVRVGPGGTKTIPLAPVIIRDAPRFPFRGLMIDSGRHFLPIEHVKKTILAASMASILG